MPPTSLRPLRRARTALVTGGAGFLGSHLSERLLAQGYQVVCLDNFLSGRRQNIDHLVGRKGFTLIERDVIEPIDVRADVIFNLACAASPPRYQKDPVHTLKTNVMGALNVLDLAVRHGGRVFQASTSEVYGDPQIHPQPEGYWGNVNSFGPRACYDEGKRAAETLFFDYSRQYGADIRIARIFNTYGPRMSPDDGRVVSNFIVQALRGEDITIHGDGSQTRSFCYVDDLLDGIEKLMESSTVSPVNLGNPVEFTVRELADLVIDLVGSRSRVVHLPLPTDDPRQRRPDIGIARSALGWEPVVPLRQGLERTIAYFADALSVGARRELAL
jgi:UDP-glucuronate decarboxylase